MQNLLPTLAALAFVTAVSAQSTWYVDPVNGDNNNTGTAPLGSAFETINYANSVATSGDVIVLAAELFGNEQGNIILGNKDLTIVGAGTDATTIRAHSILTTNVNTGFPTSPVPTQQRPVVLVEGPGRVDFRGICFDGAFAMPANGRLCGLYFRNGADGLVEDCEIKNCRAEPLSNSQVCAGLIARGDDLGDACEVTLRNTLVCEFGKGAVVSFFNATVTIEDSRIRGAGPTTALAQNGVQLSYDAGGTVRGTTITNVYYDGTSNSATGILCYDADVSVRLYDNNIGACQLGIYAESPSHPAVPIEILRNRIHCADYCIQLNGVTQATVENNSFHVNDCLALKVANDSEPNTWDHNSYSTYQGGGTYLISGTGANIDFDPRSTVDLLAGTPVTTSLPLGHAPVDMVVADFNGDGFDDFATLNQNAGVTLTVGLNTGSGTFTLTDVPVADATAAPVALVYGNFDQYLGIDLAILTKNVSPTTGQNKVYVYRNLGGIGSAFTLGSVQLLPSVVQASGIAAGNVDGDIDTDIVVTDAGSGSGGAAVLLINNGTGSYGAAFNPVTLPGTFTRPLRGAVIARLDADLHADIALLEGDGTGGTLHLLAGSGGVSGFTPFTSGPLTIGSDPTAIESYDLNGDLDNDLLIASSAPAGGEVETLENDGSGNFLRMRCNVGTSATSLAVGDIDYDWDPDSVYGDAAVIDFTGGAVTLFGSYVQGAGFGSGGLVACNVTPSAAGFGKFDGNRYADLYYCDKVAGTVTVLPGTVTARADYFGEGCPGTHSRIPHLRPTGTPGAIQPNLTYGIGVDTILPSTLTVVVFCFAPAPYLMPCQPVVNFNTQVFAWLLITDTQGEAGFPLPLQATPNLAGVAFFAQAAALDPEGTSLFGLDLALSRGLKIRLGN